MAHFFKQMHAQAVQGQYKWTKNTPFSDRQRFNLKIAGFSVGRNTVHWGNQFKRVPTDCQPFVSRQSPKIPEHYNEAQQLWLIAKRFHRTRSQDPSTLR